MTPSSDITTSDKYILTALARSMWTPKHWTHMFASYITCCLVPSCRDLLALLCLWSLGSGTNTTLLRSGKDRWSSENTAEDVLMFHQEYLVFAATNLAGYFPNIHFKIWWQTCVVLVKNAESQSWTEVTSRPTFPSTPPTWKSGSKHVMWMWYDTYSWNSNVILGLWHKPMWIYQWFAETSPASILSWWLGCPFSHRSIFEALFAVSVPIYPKVVGWGRGQGSV